jgi:hypothetical protein
MLVYNMIAAAAAVRHICMYSNCILTIPEQKYTSRRRETKIKSGKPGFPTNLTFVARLFFLDG